MFRKVAIEELRATARKALDNGATVSRRSTVTWNVSGRCEASLNLTLAGRPTRRPLPFWGRSKRGKAYMREGAQHPRQIVVADKHNNPLWVDLEVPCRKCPACLRKRGLMWTVRGMAEAEHARRTWFGTLTLAPEHHYVMLCRATARQKIGAPEFAALPAGEQFALRHREISRELTLWLKRVREQSGATLRFLLVAEAHKSGLPHYHCLVHEQHNGAPLLKRHLQSNWHLGFTNFKLVDPGESLKAVRYATKYLLKATEARVRASVQYGNPPPVGDSEACQTTHELATTSPANIGPVL